MQRPIVTLSDWFFLPALATFFQSLQENSGLPPDQQIVIIECEPLTHADRKKLAKFHFDIKFLDIREFGDYSEIMPDPFYTGMTFKSVMYWRAMFRKLLIFKLNFDKILYCDADMLCLGDITEGMDFPHLSVAPDWGLKEPQETYGGTMFNAGIMFMEPSLKDFGGIVKHCHDEFEMLSSLAGDQPLLNSYFYKHEPDVINLIPQKWNILKPLYNTNRELFDESFKDAKFVHYTSFKPWTFTKENPCPEQDRFLNNLWMQYFIRAKMTIVGEEDAG